MQVQCRENSSSSLNEIVVRSRVPRLPAYLPLVSNNLEARDGIQGIPGGAISARYRKKLLALSPLRPSTIPDYRNHG